MGLTSRILITVVAVLHVAFLGLEMFLWRRPFGRRLFGMSQAQADSSAVLAANQGLYNGFLAAGLVWSLVCGDSLVARELAIFFLSCVAAAGVFGAATVSGRIFFVQAVPAIAGLASLLLRA